jgi:hypothetical protein
MRSRRPFAAMGTFSIRSSVSKSPSTRMYAGNIFWIVGFALITSWIVAVYFTPYIGLKLLPPIRPFPVATTRSTLPGCQAPTVNNDSPTARPTSP